MSDTLTVIQLTEQRYRENLQQAAQLGAHLAMRMAGLPVRDLFTRTEMQQRHGRGTIDRLIQAGKLTPHRNPETDDHTTKRVLYSETEYLQQII
ncbi:MAG: hypothetical protein IJ640_00135 [Prevotella sp.]|nr:hypothetical protein [Prevotella sp.]